MNYAYYFLFGWLLVCVIMKFVEFAVAGKPYGVNEKHSGAVAVAVSFLLNILAFYCFYIITHQT